ncbi:MAG TPA: response regulator [Fimbriimonadaceae bacterium]|nr:response regulator [Fimbriimonadaceae bacterium]
MATARCEELVLVEDNETDEILSLRGIAKSGVECSVTVRRDGFEALDYLLDERLPPPKLIVLDYRLPKMTGLEILTALRQCAKTQLTPVVILSGTNQGDELRECYKLGANSCVAKPIDASEYIARVASITRYWLLVNQPSSHVD